MSAKQRWRDLRTDVSVSAAAWGEVRESDPDEADRRLTSLEIAISAAYNGGIDIDDIVWLTGSQNEAGALTAEQVVAILL